LSHVFVLATNKEPLHPVHPARARKLLSRGKAAVYRRFPFTIILKVAIQDPMVAELRVKIDPGSKTTGIALLDDHSGAVLFAAELSHRGSAIKKRLDKRRGVRRGRRFRHTRYRKARWQNRRRRSGWLPPSLQSRIANILTWVRRLTRVSHITQISLELVKFDLQLLENPGRGGVEYQQGTLAGYETRAYLLEKWQRTCAYCSKEHIPLQIEHIVPKARGGSNRVSNLCLSCEKCNLAKGTKAITDFLKKKPEVLSGHGGRQMCRMDQYGFVRTGPKEAKFVKGFQTGDSVRAIVTVPQEGGNVRGTGSRAYDWLIQYHHCAGNRPGHSLQLLSGRSSSGWL
jgi:5-methylcytosine-specific restriction endonuclease McrA